MDVNKLIAECGLVPVIKLKDAKNAVPLCRALAEGGLPLAEITFRTAAAAESIRRVAAELPQVFVGAGTVLTPAQVDAAADAGARFIVSPGLTEAVVNRALERDLPVFPGCATASDIERALAIGLKTVKFFPAEAMGGVSTIKALAAPYGDVKFMPTGGVNLDNLGDYLACDKVVACGGSWLAKDALVEAGDWAGITAVARASMAKVAGFALKRALLSPAFAEAGALDLASLLSLSAAAGDSTGIELSARDLPRAAAYLRRMGVALDDSSAEYDGKNLSRVFLAKRYCGCSVAITRE